VDVMQVVEAIDVARGYAGVPLDALTDAGDETRKDRLAQDDVDLERVELREELRPALEELSERDRQILVLRFVAGKNADRDSRRSSGVSQMQISRSSPAASISCVSGCQTTPRSDVDANPV